MIGNPKKHRKVDEEFLDEVRQLPCCACGWHAPSDPCHIKTQGSGGDDIWANILPMCRSCHSLQHQMGFFWMMKRFPSYKKALEKRGWKTVEIGGIKSLRNEYLNEGVLHA